MTDQSHPDKSKRDLRTPKECQPHAPQRIATVPNALCLVRFLGSFVLVAIALADRPVAFAWLFVFLALTDLIDGKIAVWFDQRSQIGARLDSWADATMYAALIFGACWLHWDQLQNEWGWLLAVILSYTISTTAGLVKFGRWPSYHTRAAKISWGLVLIAAVCLLAGWAIWPLRIAMAAVTITNIEATLLTLRLPEWRTDVTSLLHVDRDSATQAPPGDHALDHAGHPGGDDPGRRDRDERMERE